jgi:hypothetical protein
LFGLKQLPVLEIRYEALAPLLYSTALYMFFRWCKPLSSAPLSVPRKLWHGPDSFYRDVALATVAVYSDVKSLGVLAAACRCEERSTPLRHFPEQCAAVARSLSCVLHEAASRPVAELEAAAELILGAAWQPCVELQLVAAVRSIPVLSAFCDSRLDSLLLAESECRTQRSFQAALRAQRACEKECRSKLYASLCVQARKTTFGWLPAVLELAGASKQTVASAFELSPAYTTNDASVTLDHLRRILLSLSTRHGPEQKLDLKTAVLEIVSVASRDRVKADADVMRACSSPVECLAFWTHWAKSNRYCYVPPSPQAVCAAARSAGAATAGIFELLRLLADNSSWSFEDRNRVFRAALAVDARQGSEFISAVVASDLQNGDFVGPKMALESLAEFTHLLLPRSALLSAPIKPKLLASVECAFKAILAVLKNGAGKFGSM